VLNYSLNVTYNKINIAVQYSIVHDQMMGYAVMGSCTLQWYCRWWVPPPVAVLSQNNQAVL